MCRCLHANPRELLKRPNMRAARIGPHRMNLRHAVGSFLHPHRTALHLPSRVFADSTRPGVLVGPYASPAPFIAEYAAYRRTGRSWLSGSWIPTNASLRRSRAARTAAADPCAARTTSGRRRRDAVLSPLAAAHHVPERQASSSYPMGYTPVMHVQMTALYRDWINSLKDRSGWARIQVRVDRLVHGNAGQHRQSVRRRV